MGGYFTIYLSLVQEHGSKLKKRKTRFFNPIIISIPLTSSPPYMSFGKRENQIGSGVVEHKDNFIFPFSKIRLPQNGLVAVEPKNSYFSNK